MSQMSILHCIICVKLLERIKYFISIKTTGRARPQVDRTRGTYTPPPRSSHEEKLLNLSHRKRKAKHSVVNISSNREHAPRSGQTGAYRTYSFSPKAPLARASATCVMGGGGGGEGL